MTVLSAAGRAAATLAVLAGFLWAAYAAGPRTHARGSRRGTGGQALGAPAHADGPGTLDIAVGDADVLRLYSRGSGQPVTTTVSLSPEKAAAELVRLAREAQMSEAPQVAAQLAAPAPKLEELVRQAGTRSLDELRRSPPGTLPRGQYATARRGETFVVFTVPPILSIDWLVAPGKPADGAMRLPTVPALSRLEPAAGGSRLTVESASADLQRVRGDPRNRLPPELERPQGKLVACYSSSGWRMLAYSDPGSVPENYLFLRARMAFGGWELLPGSLSATASYVFTRPGKRCTVVLAAAEADRGTFGLYSMEDL